MDSPTWAGPMLKDGLQAEREQEAECARIDAAVSLAETALAGLASSDEAHKRRCELRDGTILSVADVRRNIIRGHGRLRRHVGKWLRRPFATECLVKALLSMQPCCTISQQVPLYIIYNI